MSKLSDLGFIPTMSMQPGVKRRMFVSTEGAPKTGKTDFFKRCPPPIVVIDLDKGLEGVAEQDIWGNQILKLPFDMPDLDEFSRTASPEMRNLAKAQYQRLKATVLAVFKSGEARTLCIDSGTACYALAQIARFGEIAQLGKVEAAAWTSMQAEFEGIFNKYADYNCNLIMTHRQGTKYLGLKGDTDLKGYKQMQFLSQVHVEFLKRPVLDKNNMVVKNAAGIPQQELVRRVKECRQRLALEGTEFPVYFLDDEKQNSVGGDFLTIAMSVFPNTTSDDWI